MPHPVNTPATALVAPAPPIVKDELAHIGAGLRFAQNPTGFFQDLREEYGDTFLVDVFGYRLFCLFSPTGLQNLYALDEDDASFGMATFDLMGFKTPTEIFIDTDLKLFYELLKFKRLPGYSRTIHKVLQQHCDEMGQSGELDLFDFIRSLEQRIGFALWIGEDAAADGQWQALKADFDILSQELAFVSPAHTLDAVLGGKRAEREALASLHSQLLGLWDARKTPADDSFSLLMDRFSAFPREEQRRRTVHNMINANQGFLSNLYAAIAWVMANLLEYPQCRRRFDEELSDCREKHGADFLHQMPALNSLVYSEQLLLESVRFAQRSITLRKVMKPVTIDSGDQRYVVQPGCYITTMLSVGNLDGTALAKFDPDHYDTARQLQIPLATPECVSTFGHGRHACPAQQFSHLMSKIVTATLMQNFQWERCSEHPLPASRQMGGVARPETALRLRYRRC